MDNFYSEDELLELGFKTIGKQVKISKKASFYGENDIEIGDHVRIDDFCILSGKVSIGNYVHIAAYSALYGATCGIFISDYSNISSRVSVYAISDDYSGSSMTNPMIPDEYKNVSKKPVYIEKHVIIGSTSVVMPGVTLKEGSAFGCFSYINQSSEPWIIYAGIPCKKIKNRKKDILYLEKKMVDDMNKFLQLKG